MQWLPFFATPGAERKENMQVTWTLNNLFVHFQLFADRRSCTFIFFPGQAELHFHFSCPPKTALAPNESQFTTELDGFSVKSLRNTISKLTDPPATLFWTYLIVEVLRLNWLTKMWRNYDTRNKEIVHTGLFTLKDIDLEGGFMTSRFDTQLWDISETWKVLTVIFLFVSYWTFLAILLLAPSGALIAIPTY